MAGITDMSWQTGRAPIGTRRLGVGTTHPRSVRTSAPGTSGR
jgi:hypothetical protein